MGDVVTRCDTIDNYWQIETIKSNQENVKASLSVRTVGEILPLFSVKNTLLEVFKYYYNKLYILNIFVTGAWGWWRWGDIVFSDVNSFCFCSSNLFWKFNLFLFFLFFSKFGFGNVITCHSMQMVIRTQKKQKKTIKTQNKTKIISKNIPYTTQLLKGSFQR